MGLSKKQMMDEKDAIVEDLFGKGIDPKNKIASLNSSEKEKLSGKIKSHIDFFTKIADEQFNKPDKISFRIETAKLRAFQIYPQLLKLIES
jgi:hypothetical protein